MYITALDIGTSKIKAIVGEIKGNRKPSVIGVFKAPVVGLRRGEIVAIEDVAPALSRLSEEIKQISKSALKNIFAGVGGVNVRFQRSRGIVAVSRADNEIYQDDIERVIKASQAINLGPNRTTLHTLTKEFTVDGTAGILDPLGMNGHRLEVESLIIDALKSTVGNLIKSVESVGGEISGLIYCPLAASRAVLNKTQKELGVVLVDIGAGTTSISVYEENNLLHLASLPVGALNVTNDLAIGLRCSIKTAEKIKLSFGHALAKSIPQREKLELHELDENLKSAVSRHFISEIIEIRLAEIFELVNNELKSVGKSGRLPAGAVITGGGAKIPGIVELAKQELKLPAQIGAPDASVDVPTLEVVRPEFDAKLEDPEFSVVVGLLFSGLDETLKTKGNWLTSKKPNWFRKLLKYFLP